MTKESTSGAANPAKPVERTSGAANPAKPVETISGAPTNPVERTLLGY